MSASDLPPPLTPPDCDLRGGGYEWMRLWGHRMFTSGWYRAARKDGRGGIASLKLWWAAMLQCPAGSLPNDEDELCMLADFGEDLRAWKKHREVAMYGFVLCADNRWYHHVVSEQAMEAYDRQLKFKRTREVDRERLRRWRASQNGSHPPDEPNGHDKPETQDETRFETPQETHYSSAFRLPETRFETAYETLHETSRARGEEKRREKKPPRSPPVSGGVRAAPKSSRKGFRDLERRLDAATAEPADGPTIEAAAGEVVEIDAFLGKLRRLSHG